MSARATFWAWHQTIKPATAKLVLLCLADCHNGDTNQCNPGVSYIAKMTQLDRKTVMHSIGILSDLGAITVTKKHGAGNNYSLQTSTEIGTSTKNGTSTEIGTTPVPKTVLPPVPKTVPEPKREPKKNLRRSRRCALPDDFVITEAMRKWASENVPGFDIDREFSSWVDYWRGEGELKADWVATWRNGMKSRAARAARNSPPPEVSYL